jgi:hypothetical protein
LRGLRIVASTQLSLDMGDQEAARSFWDLPDSTKAQVLGLLARLIARGVVAEDEGVVDG